MPPRFEKTSGSLEFTILEMLASQLWHSPNIKVTRLLPLLLHDGQRKPVFLLVFNLRENQFSWGHQGHLKNVSVPTGENVKSLTKSFLRPKCCLALERQVLKQTDPKILRNSPDNVLSQLFLQRAHCYFSRHYSLPT